MLQAKEPYFESTDFHLPLSAGIGHGELGIENTELYSFHLLSLWTSVAHVPGLQEVLTFPGFRQAFAHWLLQKDIL